MMTPILHGARVSQGNLSNTGTFVYDVQRRFVALQRRDCRNVILERSMQYSKDLEWRVEYLSWKVLLGAPQVLSLSFG